ncbi:MAG: flagellar assembly protein FliH [Gammaproteobacteria bacterium]|nr:flagellar assembly protein FliH [Gammaproteobacteria bacterium]
MSGETRRSKIISGSDALAWQPPMVSGMLLHADGSREELHLPTAGDLEALQKEAAEEGYRQGFEEGRAAGEAAGRKQMLDAAKYLESVIQRLAMPLEEVDDAVIDSIADLSLLLTRQLVRRELKTAPGEVVAVVKAALSQLPVSARHPRLRLNPEDVELVKDVLGMDGDDKRWRIEADPIVARGGCLVETESSFIDATVEARIAALASKMLGGNRGSDNAA